MIGLNQFLDFAFARKSIRGKIPCPCEKCRFYKWQTRDEVFNHCLKKPFPRNYLFWIHHGEGDGDFIEIGSSSQVGMRVDGSDDDQDDDDGGRTGGGARLRGAHRGVRGTDDEAARPGRYPPLNRCFTSETK